MESEVIIVAVNASREITDYALEWAVRNLTKAMDSLIVLAVVPSRACPPTPANRTQQLLSGLLKKWSLMSGNKEENSSENSAGSMTAVQQDVWQRINNVCEQMAQQLCLKHNKRLHIEVKVIADAQLGSVSTAAAELEPTWIVLDRHLKKEGDFCLKHLDCNVVVVDHAIPKVLRAVSPLAGKRFSVSGDINDPTVADMLGVEGGITSNQKNARTQTGLGTETRISDTDPSISLSLSTSSEKKQSSETSLSTNKSESCPSQILCLKSDLFHPEAEEQAMVLSPSSLSKSQALNESMGFSVGEVPHKSLASPAGQQDQTQPKIGEEKLDISGERGDSPESNMPVPTVMHNSGGPDIVNQISDVDPSVSLLTAEKEQSYESILYTNDFISPPRCLHLKFDGFSQEAKGQATLSPSFCKLLSLQAKATQFDFAESPQESSASHLDGQVNSHTRLLKAKSDSAVADFTGIKTRSSLDIDSEASDVDQLKSLASTAEKDQPYEDTRYTKRSESPLHFNQELDVRATLSPSSLNIGERVQKSSSGLVDGRNEIYSFHSKTRSDIDQVLKLKVLGTTIVPARRSTDSACLLRNPEATNQLNLSIPKRYPSKHHGEENSASISPTTIERISSVRKAMSLSIKHLPTPPPLCSICKHNVPILGKSPRKFGYREIELATDGFSSSNLLAEGRYGSLYKGILTDGQVVAVKQHKTMTAQEASEFCSEVEVLSCAQHRNLVALVGYCTEKEWLLVYEFACNGSLDKHLYGGGMNEVMAWKNRVRVAMGAARGLRYLHEDCRVGCIVHRDFRPNNILLTHDFEPMVGDFGLARCQADGQSAEETQVIGAFGYLAPEYTQTGLITEKADVYAFGVVLLELLSGIKATEFAKSTGKQFVLEWGRPLLKKKVIGQIIDPGLEGNYVENEVLSMMYASNLCTSPDPEERPRMSKVLKILEGDMLDGFGRCYEPYTSSYPNQYVNRIYGTESSAITPTLDHSHSAQKMQPLVHPNPSRRNVHRKNHLSSESQKKITTMRHKESELSISEEYQAYLRESLAKFIQNRMDIEKKTGSS